KVGSTLLVPRTRGRLADVSLRVADNAMMELAPDAPALKKLSLKAGRLDSVASVARRYHLSAAQVAQWNDMAPAATFKPGQTVLVYVAAKGHGARAIRTAQAAPKQHAVGHAKVARSATAERIARKGVRVAHNN
ncbi:MAG TPA: LysM domain-containing protein, partial [Caldimonas sp.]